MMLVFRLNIFNLEYLIVFDLRSTGYCDLENKGIFKAGSGVGSPSVIFLPSRAKRLAPFDNSIA